MDDKELHKIIESGILESYVLGDVSPEDEAYVLRLSNEYPEIKAEIERIERTLESVYQANAVAVPPHVKATIMDQTIGQSGGIDNPSASSPQKPWAWIITAIVLGVCAIMSLIYMSVMQAGNEQRIQLLTEEMATVRSDCNEQGEVLALVTSPNSLKIQLQGTELDESAGALVFYNDESGKAIFFGQGLPDKVDELSFQLWAIIDGVPVDLGLVEQDDSGKIISISLSGEVQAFAITIEPQGGSEEPTLSQMLVFGAPG